MPSVSALKSPSKIVFAVVALGALIAGASFFYASTQSPGSAAGRHLQDAPPFELKDNAGETWKSQSVAGKVLVLHFWAAWCAPCIEELPKWSEFANAYATQEAVKFVAISLDPSWKEANAVLSKSALPASVVSLIDPEQKTSEAFGSFQFPESYLISRSGKILMKWVGPQNWGSPQLQSVIELALRAEP